MKEKIKAALFGLAVGDALGVPVEFIPRDRIKANPVTGMREFGTWEQPAGTWSDDSSLAFCLAESLTGGYNLDDIAANFVKWMQTGYWGARHKVFDIGNTTSTAINRLAKGWPPQVSGALSMTDNGNGSLMRILPLLFVIHDLPIEERYEKIKEVSAVTHGHFRSVFACFIYMEKALLLLKDASAADAYTEAVRSVDEFTRGQQLNPEELMLFKRVLNGELVRLEESSIHSGGYVLHTLEASLWCLLTTGSYEEAVLKAVNLGNDTDTTACVTGGLAGLLYGFDAIPAEWLRVLARKEDIEELCERLNDTLNGKRT